MGFLGEKYLKIKQEFLNKSKDFIFFKDFKV